MQFTIVHTESLEYRFDYEADMPEQAMQMYHDDLNDGKIHFDRPYADDEEDHVVPAAALAKETVF